MKRSRRFLAAMGLLAVLLIAGCRGVVMNPQYSDLLDRTAGLSNETARRAAQGELTSEQMTAALTAQADTWRKFQAARDGRDGQ